jgi:hypothetical protein
VGANSGIIKFFLWNPWADQSLGSIDAASVYGTDFVGGETRIQARNRVWRSTSTTNQWLLRDLGSAYTMGAIAVVYPHQLTTQAQLLSTPSVLSIPTLTATVRARISNNADMSAPLYDSGTANVWETVYSASEMETASSSEFFAENGMPDATTQKYLSGMTKVFILPAEVAGRYIRLDCSDPANSMGYIDVAYVYAGRYFEAGPDLLYGWKLGRSEAARKPISSGGTMWQSRIFQRTKLSLVLAPQSEASLTAYWALYSVLIGTRHEILVQVIDKSSSFKFHTTVYGRLTANPKYTEVGFKRYSAPFEIDEIIA